MEFGAPLSVSPTLLAPTPSADAAQSAKRGEIRQTAQKFEAAFLSVMLQQMFQDVKTSAPFGGGAGEDMFKSFMAEAMAKQMTQAGGVGLSDSVAREMLKLQGLEK
jgi:Rod binding domain-containing protein